MEMLLQRAPRIDREDVIGRLKELLANEGKEAKGQSENGDCGAVAELMLAQAAVEERAAKCEKQNLQEQLLGKQEVHKKQLEEREETHPRELEKQQGEPSGRRTSTGSFLNKNESFQKTPRHLRATNGRPELKSGRRKRGSRGKTILKMEEQEK